MRTFAVDPALIPPKWRDDPAFRPRTGPRNRAARRPPKPDADVQARLVRAIALRLTPDTCFFAMPDAETDAKRGLREGVPALIFVHRGRALGLELQNGGRLRATQRDVQAALRAAGMRIEVARSFGEAMALLHDMGIPLKSEDAP